MREFSAKHIYPLFLIILLMLNTIIPTCYSISINGKYNSLETIYTVFPTGEVKVTISFTALNYYYKILLDGKPINNLFFINTNGTAYILKYDNTTNTLNILLYNETNVTIIYYTNDLTFKNKSLWLIKLEKPEGKVVIEFNRSWIIIPKEIPDDIMYSKNWVKFVYFPSNITDCIRIYYIPISSNYIHVNESPPLTTSNYTIPPGTDHKSENPIIYPYVFLAIILAIVLPAAILIARYLVRKKHEIQVYTSALDDRDLLILDYIKKSGGTTNISSISKSLNIPKSVVSRKVKKLEKLNIVATEKRGKIKIVKLRETRTKQ